MPHTQLDVLFSYLIEGFEPQKRATLMNMYNSCIRAEEDNHRRELEDLKKGIVNEVLSLISVQADTKNAVMQIQDLKKSLNDLTK